MIIITKPEASQESLRQLVADIEAQGLKTTVVVGTEKTIVGVVGDTRRHDDDRRLGHPTTSRACARTGSSSFSKPSERPVFRSSPRS